MTILLNYHRDNTHFSNMNQACPKGKNLELLVGYVDWMTDLGFVVVVLFWIATHFRLYHLDLVPPFYQFRRRFHCENRDN